jgi:hypothetical protein
MSSHHFVSRTSVLCAKNQSYCKGGARPPADSAAERLGGAVGREQAIITASEVGRARRDRQLVRGQGI